MMTKKGLVLAAVLGAVPLTGMAQQGGDNVGGCGWGSKLMEGQRGIVGQSLAVTTNGFLGNQTFGITSGTAGCTQDGVVQSNWQLSMFIDGNQRQLARDMAAGEGETLDALAALLGIEEGDRVLFKQAIKNNYSSIYASHDASVPDITAGLKRVLAEDVTLAQYSARVS